MFIPSWTVMFINARAVFGKSLTIWQFILDGQFTECGTVEAKSRFMKSFKLICHRWIANMKRKETVLLHK